MNDETNSDKELYSFNPENLKQRFFELANNAFINHNTYMKQYNLLLFRTLFPQLPLPDLLFTYSTDLSYDYDTLSPISELLKSYIEDTNSKNHGSYSISNILRNCFRFKNPLTSVKASLKTQLFKPEPTFFKTPMESDDDDVDTQIDRFVLQPEVSISFINDFFCISTFPAFFGHFSSEEYIRAGFNFIKLRIKDPLAPNLVAVFLLHCSQFRDRLLEAFIDNMIYEFDQIKTGDHLEEDIEQKFSTDNLLNILYNSFEECIFYFTEYHFDIINILRQKDEEEALLAVCYYFLREVVSLFKYSPLLSETGLLSKCRCPKNPATYARIMRVDYLDNITDQLCVNRTFSMKILDLFQKMSFGYAEMPKISTIKYQDGFNFCLSLADIRVLNCLYYAERYPNKSLEDYPRYTNIRDFLLEMFTIKGKFRQYIKTDIQEPKRTETSTEMTAKKLEEQKEFHNFLTEHSNGMKHLEICASCALDNLKLKEKQYASNLWKSSNKVNYAFEADKKFANSYSLGSSPINFETEMLTSFCFSLINGQLHLEQNYQSLIAGKANLQELYPKIKNYLLNNKSDKPLRDHVFETVIYFLDDICNFTSSGKSFAPELIEPSIFVCDAIERTTFDLLIMYSNSIPCRFIKSELPETPAGELIENQINFDEFRSQNLAQFLSFNTDKPPPLPTDEEVGDNDDLIPASTVESCSGVLIKGTRMLKTIIFLSNHSMLNEYNLVIEKFRTGDKLHLFLIIADMIEKTLERCEFGHLGPNYYKYFYTYVIKDEFKYFTGNLINCINIFTDHFTENQSCYPSISKDIIKKLNFLKEIFNVSQNISRLVYN